MNIWFLYGTGLRACVPTSRKRRYQAALGTLLAVQAFECLDGQQRSKVDDELVVIYEPFGIYPCWKLRRDVSRTSMAADRAVAMCRLGFPTGLQGLEWSEVLHPWHLQNPALVKGDFRLQHPATEEARLFLRSRGLPENI